MTVKRLVFALLSLVVWVSVAAAQPLGRQLVILYNAGDPTGTVTQSATVIVDGAKEFINFHVILTTLTSTNIITTIDCRERGASTWYTIETITQTAVGDQFRSIAQHCYQVRVGVKSTGDVAGDSHTVRLAYR